MLNDEQREAIEEACEESYLDPRLRTRTPPVKRVHHRKRSAGLIAAGLCALVLFAPRSYGLFGAGDVVFDPSSWAVLGHIWEQDISSFAKLTESVTQLARIYQSGQQMYQLASEMRVAIEHPSSLTTIAYSTAASVTQSRGGATIDWNRVINSRSTPDAIAAAWKRSTRQITDGDLSLFEADGNASQRRADLATVEMIDGAAKACIENVGNYRGGNQLNAITRQLLRRYRLGDAQTSYMTQYQAINAGGEHELNEQLAGNSLATCESELRIADMKLKRDEAVARLQTSADYDNGKTLPTYNDSSASVDSLRGLLP